jgi:hypothetical protein
MAMRGHIKVGLWLPFTAEQTVDGRSFAWRARVGRGPLTPLRVTDQYAGAAGSTEGRLLGRVTLFHAHDADTSTSLPSNPRSACASTTTVPYKRSALCVGATPAGRRSNTSFRRRDPRRAPLRRPRASQQRQRRLVVRHPALRAVLPCSDQRGHANAPSHLTAMRRAASIRQRDRPARCAGAKGNQYRSTAALARLVVSLAGKSAACCHRRWIIAARRRSGRPAPRPRRRSGRA